MSLLFEPIKFGTLQLSRRIVIAPMCQYSAKDGFPTYWHAQQWGTYALSGAALVIIEATAVQAEGRITYADVGIWTDEHAEKIKHLIDEVHQFAPTPFAIQLAHAGRKASCDKPWQSNGEQLTPHDPLGWQTVAPSAIAHNPSDVPPSALSIEEIRKVQEDFAAAAKRAVAAGIALIEVHAAHGYLLHQFLSPLSNQRDDQYGGSLDNRMRMTLETFKAIKAVVPEDFPIGVRISATDWMEQGWDVASSIELSKQLEALGAAYIHVSSGGLHPDQKIDIGPGYQVPFADAIKKVINIPVIAVGLITEAEQAEDILQKQQADAIAIARAQLYDPRWAWHAAATLGDEIGVAPQYLRSQPHGLKDLFHSFAP